MKTTILLTIEHTKPLPDITDVICQRVWPYGGGCITDMTAAIQPERTERQIYEAAIAAFDVAEKVLSLPICGLEVSGEELWSRDQLLKIQDDAYAKGRRDAEGEAASAMEAMTAALERKYSTDCTSPDYLCPAGRVQIGLPAFRSQP